MMQKIGIKNLLLVVAVMLLSSCEKPLPEFKQLLVYPKKNPITDFSLTHHTGKTFDQNGFKGKWNLIFMGYTHCPDVCPLTLTEIDKIYAKIPQEKQADFQVIFLSVDPNRDQPDHLSQYVGHFNDDFSAITGEKEQIDKLVYSLGGIYSINNEDPEHYSVDHTGRIFIVSPQGERFGIISSEAMHNKDKSGLVDELVTLSYL